MSLPQITWSPKARLLESGGFHRSSSVSARALETRTSWDSSVTFMSSKSFHELTDHRTDMGDLDLSRASAICGKLRLCAQKLQGILASEHASVHACHKMYASGQLHSASRAQTWFSIMKAETPARISQDMIMVGCSFCLGRNWMICFLPAICCAVQCSKSSTTPCRKLRTASTIHRPIWQTPTANTMVKA